MNLDTLDDFSEFCDLVAVLDLNDASPKMFRQHLDELIDAAGMGLGRAALRLSGEALADHRVDVSQALANILLDETRLPAKHFRKIAMGIAESGTRYALLAQAEAGGSA